MSSTISENPGIYRMDMNKVTGKNFHTSGNFYGSDRIFRNYLKSAISSEGMAYMEDKLNALGKEAAGRMNELSLLADKFGPELIKRNFLGETIDEIRFHPAYNELFKIAVKSEMFRVKWEPSLRKKFVTERQRLSFAAGYFYSMSECGIYCPLCMTDGVARLIDMFCSAEDKKRLLPHIYTNNADEFFTGAMYLTEKTGGSDVGANIAIAGPLKSNMYSLTGEKWFCSNANADLIFALARTDEKIQGTKGLSIFLIEKFLPSGERNPIEIIRLKEKLGVRSMATAECMLSGALGKLTGKEFEGFKVMVEMINLSRLYNSVAALACSRRALIEVFQFLSHRSTFGKTAMEHSLIRSKLTELGALNAANFYLVWRVIKALDSAENGDEREAALFRIINPMTKKWSAETGVYITRESMELMGGIGYIEDGIMPKLMRDVMVLPIWEGSGNIIILDMLRAMEKSDGLNVLFDEINSTANKKTGHEKFLKTELNKLAAFTKKLRNFPQDKKETSAKFFFEKLTTLYQISLLLSNLNEESRQWILPSLDFLIKKYSPSELKEHEALSAVEVRNLVAWEF